MAKTCFVCDDGIFYIMHIYSLFFACERNGIEFYLIPYSPRHRGANVLLLLLLLFELLLLLPYQCTIMQTKRTGLNMCITAVIDVLPYKTISIHFLTVSQHSFSYKNTLTFHLVPSALLNTVIIFSLLTIFFLLRGDYTRNFIFYY